MSNGKYDDYAGRTSRTNEVFSSDTATRVRAETERSARMRDEAARTKSEAPRERAKPMERTAVPVDARLACNRIGAPPAAAEELTVILIDHSASNELISKAFRSSAAYLHAMLAGLGPKEQAIKHTVSIVFFSDHTDGDELMQEVNWTVPGERGSQILRASIDQVRSANGGDAPEAIECALLRASNLNFGEIPKSRRHLMLVSDQVAHGMSGPDVFDEQCPDQVYWKDSLKRVHEEYATFEMIACGDKARVFELQKQFITPERRQFDLVNLSTGKLTHEERCRLVVNFVLLLMARNMGEQTIEKFLFTLAEKWISEPQYGAATLPRAKEQIKNFLKYVDIPEEDRDRLMDRCFAGT